MHLLVKWHIIYIIFTIQQSFKYIFKDVLKHEVNSKQVINFSYCETVLKFGSSKSDRRGVSHADLMLEFASVSLPTVYFLFGVQNIYLDNTLQFLLHFHCSFLIQPS